MTSFGNADGNPAVVMMSDAQLETLIAKIVPTGTGASPTPNDLTDDQPRVVLQYQLLRNGLIRHSLPAETTSQVLIGITQQVCDDKLELIADDPIPQAAVSLKVTIGADHRQPCLQSWEPGKVFAEVEWCKDDPGVSLVEFIDKRKNLVAAGIPSPLEKSHQDHPWVSSLAESVISKVVELYGVPPSGIVVTAAQTQSAGDEGVASEEVVEVFVDPSSSESADPSPTTPTTQRGRNPRRGDS